MDRYKIIDELKPVIAACLENQGVELVDLICFRQGKDLFLRILADQPEGGISLDECSRLNREIGLLLDEKNILSESYILEVSSPGLDRPLFTRNDFARCKNRKVKFFLKELIAGKLEWDGVINKVGEESLSIDINGEILEIPISKINKAKQILGNI